MPKPDGFPFIFSVLSAIQMLKKGFGNKKTFKGILGWKPQSVSVTISVLFLFSYCNMNLRRRLAKILQDVFKTQHARGEKLEKLTKILSYPD